MAFLPKKRKIATLVILLVAILAAIAALATIMALSSTKLRKGKNDNQNLIQATDISNDADNSDDESNDATTTPTDRSTNMPSISSTNAPSTKTPTLMPSMTPSEAISTEPTVVPTLFPTTMIPTISPSTLSPTLRPITKVPTWHPTTKRPTSRPTTTNPTVYPTLYPTTKTPTLYPTLHPTTLHPTPFIQNRISPDPTLQPVLSNESGNNNNNNNNNNNGSNSPGEMSDPPETTLTETMTRFYAIGDVPYTTLEAEELRVQMSALPQDAEFLIHVGDIRSARDGSRCEESEYAAVAEILLMSHAPVFMVMGDNEWNDCPNVNQGYNHWQTVFGNFDQHWGHSFNVIRPEDKPENFAFVHKQTLFIGLNLVGGRVHRPAEWASRLQNHFDWVKEMVMESINPTFPGIDDDADVVKSVVIFGHANPTDDHSAFFDPLSDFIDNDLANINLPFLYLNGDAHAWRHEPNFFGVSQFLRIQVEGGTRDPPLQVTIDPSQVLPQQEGEEISSPMDVFTYDRMLLI